MTTKESMKEAAKTAKAVIAPISFVLNVKEYIFFSLLFLVVGVGAGWWMNQTKHTAGTAPALQANAKKSAQNTHKAVKQSQKIEDAIAKGEAQADRVRRAAVKRVEKQEKAREQAQPDASDSPYRLDVGTVRLLNAARKGAGVESAGGSDETLAAPSDIGVKELVENDLEIVRMYHDLATRHDALVDYVEKRLKEQAK